MSRPRDLGEPSVEAGDLFGGGAQSSIDVTEYLKLLRRRWKLVAVITLLSLGAFGIRFSMTPKQYYASAQIQIERGGLANLAGDSNPMSAWFENFWNREYYPTQYRLLQSRGVAELAVKNLRLAENPAFNPGGVAVGGAPTAAQDQAVLAALANRLLSGLQITPIAETQLVEVGYVSSDPRLAAQIAQGMVEAFIQWKSQTRSTTVSQATSFLDEQIEALKREIEDKDQSLRELGRTVDIVTSAQSPNQTLDRLEVLNNDYIQAVAQRIDKEATFNELSNAPKETVADTLSNGVVSGLRSEQLRLEREYATNLNTFKPGYPSMVELQSKIDKGREHLESVIDETVNQAIRAARAEYQTALRRERALLDEIERLKNQDLRNSPAVLNYNNLQIELASRRQLLDELTRKQSETMVVSSLQGEESSNVRLVDRALVPGGPFRPSLRREIMFGLAVGLMLGIGLVLLLEFLDRTVKTPEQVESLLALPTLAVIPDLSASGRGYGYGYGYGYGQGSGKRRKSRGKRGETGEDVDIELLPHTKPRLAPSEAYRSLRTALLLSTADEMRSVVVTSAESGEGKTTTATNLATVLAQLGRRVLLIDADLRRPRLHTVFGTSNRVGLVSCLAAHSDVAGACVATDVPNLALLPSGPSPPNPAELLSSDRMKEVLDEVSRQFDFVVVDSPPVLAVTDATVLGALTGYVLLTVASGKTGREEAKSALTRLRHAETKVLGVVLNRFRPTGSRRSRYYAQYESYGASASDAEHSAA